MKKYIKRILLTVLCFALVLSCTACGDPNELVDPLVYNPDHGKSSADSYVAAENDTFQLKWDSENKRILLYNKVKGITHSSMPEEMLDPNFTAEGNVAHPKMNTTLLVEYVHTEDFTTKTVNAFGGSLNKRDYEFEKLDNGFKITYYFSSIDVSVPVTYTLLEDGIKISVNPMEISETPAEYVSKIIIAPFFASVPNVDDDAYLFYPSGSGAIINANNSDEISTFIKEDVYGRDALIKEYMNVYPSNREMIRMPVFGAKNDNVAILGVISDGAETAMIEGDIGNQNIGYSGLYASFNVRGSGSASKVLNGIQYTNQYADTLMSVSYYPLYDDEADYVGMANRYRKYLMEEKGMTDKEEKASTSISFIGGTKLDTSFLGMPTTEIFATTTVNQVNDILTELDSTLKLPIVADMFGFGASGVDFGKPAGNLQVAKNIGNAKQVKSLAAKCKELGIDLYYDYDLVYFNANGQGLTLTSGGAAKSPGLTYRRYGAYQLGTLQSEPHVYLVGRGELAGLADKTIDKVSSMNVGGVSYRSLTSKAYSDSYTNKYIAKANMGSDVANILKKANEKGLKTLSNQGNDYTAINSSAVIDAPITSSHSYLFDYDVPFYQIVFKGYTSIYGPSVNMTTDRDLTILRSIEGGTGLSYTLINNYDNVLLNSQYQVFNSLMYVDNKDEINETVNAHSDYFNAIADAHIVDHICVTNEVRKVVYDNGTSVYINYGETDYMSPLGNVPVGSYIYGKEGN